MAAPSGCAAQHCCAHSGLVLSLPLCSAAFGHKETRVGKGAPLSQEIRLGEQKKRPLVLSPQQSRLFLFLNYAKFSSHTVSLPKLRIPFLFQFT